MTDDNFLVFLSGILAGVLLTLYLLAVIPENGSISLCNGLNDSYGVQTVVVQNVCYVQAGNTLVQADTLIDLGR